MFKSQWVVAAVALYVGIGLFDGDGHGPGSQSSPPAPPPPVNPHAHTGQSSNEKPPAGAAPGTVTQQSLVEGNYQPPAKPNHDVNGPQGNVKVDTQALTLFAGNMDILATQLATSYTAVTTIKPVAAGAFPSAIKISKNVATLAGETGTALNNLVIALRDLRDAMKKVAADYHSTEDASKMTADKLTQYTTDVTRATNAANSSTH